jgi:ATP-dependent DNA ligase
MTNRNDARNTATRHRDAPAEAGRPAGSDWIHEIKLDGFRLMTRGDAARSPPQAA